MGWIEIATVKLTKNWQYIPEESTIQELFKITHIYDQTKPIYGKCIICQAYFEPNFLLGFHSLIASSFPKVIIAPVPTPFLNQFRVYRFLGVKFRRYKFGKGLDQILEGTNLDYSVNIPDWSIKIETFI